MPSHSSATVPKQSSIHYVIVISVHSSAPSRLAWLSQPSTQTLLPVSDHSIPSVWASVADQDPHWNASFWEAESGSAPKCKAGSGSASKWKVEALEGHFGAFRVQIWWVVVSGRIRIQICVKLKLKSRIRIHNAGEHIRRLWSQCLGIQS
jgi:hypothetical protein